MKRTLLLATCVALAGVGCAGRGATSPPAATRPAATRPAVDPRALLPLDQIEPQPILHRRPTTAPSRRPPVEALHLYAQARGALLQSDRLAAIGLLEKAIKLDPDSFELYYELGLAHAAGGAGNEQAIIALEGAAALNADDLELQLQLGRQHMARGNLAKAIEHLRLAMQTGGFGDQPDLDGAVELLLARALQQQGYLAAALEQYQRVLQQLDGPRLSLRGNPELSFLYARPERLHLQMAELYEKIGRPDQAVDACRAAIECEPDLFEMHARLVDALVNAGRDDEAAKTALDLLNRFRSSPDSLSLLRTTYDRLGRADRLADDLKRLRRQRPDDRPLLFALAEVLAANGQAAEAEQVLNQAVQASGYSPELVRPLFDLYERQHDTVKAAGLLVEASARQQDSWQQFAPLWNKLLRASTRNRIRLPALQKLEVSPQAQAARLYWTARVADVWGRDAVAASSLQQATGLRPPYRPAYRELLNRHLERAEAPGAVAEKKLAEQLIARAAAEGDAGLAAELRGLWLLKDKEPEAAIKELDEAVRLGNRSPDVQYAQIIAHLSAGREVRGEQLLWKLLSDWPQYDEAYRSLFVYYLNRNAVPQAIKVLQTWLSADPASMPARLLQVRVLWLARQADAAESMLMSLFREEPDSPDVVGAVAGFYIETGRLDELLRLLEEQHTRQPDNRVVVEHLVRLYADGGRYTDAVRVLDEARSAASTDADVLYFIAHLYEQARQSATTEQVLEQVITLDPGHAPANNDLGYMWADAGRNLGRAEKMIRLALEAEPDNAAFLDSLGWVLYKRGRFEEAQRYLQQAVDQDSTPDAVVLDHLADALYRLDRPAEAARLWQQSLDGLPERGIRREELKQLRLQLLRKLKQHQGGQAVNVAPLGEGAEASQAKNGSRNHR